MRARVRGIARIVMVSFCALIVIQPLNAAAVFVPDDWYWDAIGGQDKQWAPEQMKVDYAWDLTGEGTLSNPGSDNIIVALIDTGMDIGHTDLTTQSFWSNPEEVNGQTAVDDDENGYTDDKYGWDWVEGSGMPALDEGIDEGGGSTYYRGTHVAGIIGALILGDGIAGMAQVEFMVLRIVDTDGSWQEQDAEDAIEYAVGEGADIIITPWYHAYDSEDPWDYLDDEAEDALSEDVLWVSPSGNDDSSHVGYPARSEDVLGVGACYPDDVDDDDHRMQGSNYGPKLDLIAPGGRNGYEDDSIFSTIDDDEYEARSGTEQAAAHVVGVAGLIMTYRPRHSAGRVSEILKASCYDITDQAPKRDDDAEDGWDEETGWGEVDAQKALADANFLRNRWSDGLMFGASDNEPYMYSSIALDSEGYSHIVYLEKNDYPLTDELMYVSIAPAGRIWNGPTSLETTTTDDWDSDCPDVYVDKDDFIHICWVERSVEVGRDDIYYQRLSTGGNRVEGPTEVTNDAADMDDSQKFGLNIVTLENKNPLIMFIREADSQEDTYFFTTIWKVTYSSGQWNDPELYISTGDDSYAYLGNIDICNDDIIVIAWMNLNTGTQYLNGMDEEESHQIGTNGRIPVYPRVATNFMKKTAYTVFSECNVQGNQDAVYLRAFDVSDWPPEEFTYGCEKIMVGQLSELNGEVFSDFSDLKIAVGEVSHTLNREGVRNSIQVDIVWSGWSNLQQSFVMFYSERCEDGRSLIQHGQDILVNTDAYASEIVASQRRADTALKPSYWDVDGNFRLLYDRTYAGMTQYYFMSTRERWKDVRDVGNDDYPLKNPDIDVDEQNGLHLVFEDRHNNNGVIYYACWLYGSRPPMPPTTAPIQISNGQHNCIEPKVTTVVETQDQQQVIRAIVVYKDMNLQSNSGELWLTKVSTAGAQVTNGRLGCTPLDWVTEYDHEIANDRERGRVGVVWHEAETGRGLDIHFGIVDYGNSAVFTENQNQNPNIIQGCQYNDVDPDVDVDSSGNYHIVYKRDTWWTPTGTDIYYNLVYYDFNAQSWQRYHANDIKVDDVDDDLDSSEPTIIVDRDINRRSENARDRDDSIKEHRFVHIAYCRMQAENYRYMLWYTKLDFEGEIVISEKDVTTLATDRDNYYSDVTLVSDMALNKENQVVIVYHGEVHHGTNWPAFWDSYGVFFTKLDNNGEVLTLETYISHSESRDSQFPRAVYDNNDRLNVVWQYNSASGWTIEHCYEVETLY